MHYISQTVMGENLIELHHVNCSTTFLASWFWDDFFRCYSSNWRKRVKSGGYFVAIQFGLFIWWSESFTRSRTGIRLEEKIFEIKLRKGDLRLTSPSQYQYRNWSLILHSQLLNCILTLNLQHWWRFSTTEIFSVVARFSSIVIILNDLFLGAKLDAWHCSCSDKQHR